MRSLTLIILVLSVVGYCSASYASASHTIKPNGEVQAAIEPVLDAMLAVSQHDSRATEFELGKCLEKVFEDKSAVGDESLVALLSFYIGEGNGGDLLHEVTIRGKRMLPLLARYRDKAVVLEQEARFAKIRMPVDIRRQNFTTAVKFIKAGKAWGSA